MTGIVDIGAKGRTWRDREGWMFWRAVGIQCGAYKEGDVLVTVGSEEWQEVARFGGSVLDMCSGVVR